MTGPLIHPGLAKVGNGWAVATRRLDDFDVAPATADIQPMRSESKAEFGELKAELHAREARLIKWVAESEQVRKWVAGTGGGRGGGRGGGGDCGEPGSCGWRGGLIGAYAGRDMG